MTERTAHTVETDPDVPSSEARPTVVYLLMAVLVFQGLSGLAGGFGLMSNPTGEALGMSQEWLADTPFASYVIPGVILFTVLGLGPLAAAFGVFRKTAWARGAAAATGAGLVIWIAVQIAMIGYIGWPPLQAIYALVGLAILALALGAPPHRP